MPALVHCGKFVREMIMEWKIQAKKPFLDTNHRGMYNKKAAHCGRQREHGVRNHLLDYKGKQVIYMSAFEIISTILMVIALLFTAYNIGKSNRK